MTRRIEDAAGRVRPVEGGGSRADKPLLEAKKSSTPWKLTGPDRDLAYRIRGEDGHEIVRVWGEANARLMAAAPALLAALEAITHMCGSDDAHIHATARAAIAAAKGEV